MINLFTLQEKSVIINVNKSNIIMNHSPFSPSASHRWLACPASVKLEALFPYTSSKYAEEGLKAHEFASKLINTKPKNHADIMAVMNHEMAEYCKGYMQFIVEKARVLGDGNSFLIEKKIEFNELIKEGYGTVDCAIINNDKAIIIDFKYGLSKISAVKNTQLMLYALAIKQSNKNLQTFELCIFQPRPNNISCWTCNLDELNEFGEMARSKAKEAMSDKPSFSPSYQACRWCRAAHSCRALNNKGLSLLKPVFEPEISTEFEQKELINNEKMIKLAIDKTKEHLLLKLKNGGEVEGFGLAKSRTLRKWNQEAEQFLQDEYGDQCFEKKLLSPAKMKKLLEPEIIERLTYKPEGVDILQKNES